MKRKNETHKVFIVEDDKQTIDEIKSLISIYPNFEIAGETGYVDEAVMKIIHHQPDLILFDIQLSDGNAFDVIQKINNKGIDACLIFITSYDEYAIQAIKAGAFDYLLKPIKKEEFQAAIIKFLSYEKRCCLETNIEKIVRIFEKRKIKIPTSIGFMMVDPEDILYLEAEGSYTKIFFTDGKNKLISTHLGKILEELKGFSFCRISRSLVVNNNFITEIDTKKRICLLEYNSLRKELKISRRNFKFI